MAKRKNKSVTSKFLTTESGHLSSIFSSSVEILRHSLLLLFQTISGWFMHGQVFSLILLQE